MYQLIPLTEEAIILLNQGTAIFPEIEYDKVDKIRGMDIIFVTTAETDEEARELLRLLECLMQANKSVRRRLNCG